MTNRSKSCCTPKSEATNAAPELSHVDVRKPRAPEDEDRDTSKDETKSGGCCCGPKS